jgi:hypothetical protein
MRQRPLKPSFFKNELLAQCAFEWRLLFEGLWCLADREGRLKEELVKIKAEILPNDPVDVCVGLARLAEVGLITRYTTDTGLRLIAINCWPDHAKPWSDEPASRLPGPAGNVITSLQLTTAAGPMLPLAFDDDDASRKGSLGDPEGAPRSSHGSPASTSTSVRTSNLVPVPPPPRAPRAAGEGDTGPVTTRAERFETFWEAYPRKQGRGAAFRSWERLKPTDALLARMLAAIDQQRRSHAWLRERGRFIPNPAKWLDDEGWLYQGMDAVVVAVGGAVSPRAALNDLDHIQKTREVTRLIREEGLSRAEASRRVGYR